MQPSPSIDTDAALVAPSLSARTILITLCFAGLLVALYSWIAADLALEWWTEDSASYGMLIPPTALYIAYLRREYTFAIPARSDARGLWLLALGCALLLFGKLAAEFFLMRISMVFVLAGITWTFWGKERFKTLLFPFVLLLTMVPLPSLVYNAVAAPLQLFASKLATDFAQFLGVSAYRDGNVIQLANTSLGVAEACSGLHSLSALMVASLLLGYLESGTVFKRFLLFLFSVPFAIAVNVLRVSGTAVLADYKLEYAMGFYHSFSGWLVFIAGFVVLWVASKILFRKSRQTAEVTA